MSSEDFLARAKALHPDLEFVSEYQGMHEQITLSCRKHGPFTKQAKEVIHQQQGCPKCKRTVTKPHALLNSWLDLLGVAYEENDRRTLAGLEIDTLVPEHKLGIEVNGVYWHTEQFVPKDAHCAKTALAEAAGIRLLQFWDFEIHEKPEIVQSMLCARMGKAKRIYARQTRVVRVSHKSARRFLQSTHLQGAGNLPADSLCLGLAVDKTLYLLMVFCKPRFDRKCEWEIYRISSKLQHVVVGGASRLFSAFIAKVNPTTVMSYADRRYSKGDVYATLGFTHSHDSKPGYFYAYGKQRVSRFAAQKRRLGTLLSNFDDTKTEKENMLAHGYFRAHDSGNSVWLWSRPQAD